MNNIHDLRIKFDQLTQAMVHYGRYAGYEEADINFNPTYKLDKDKKAFVNKKN